MPEQDPHEQHPPEPRPREPILFASVQTVVVVVVIGVLAGLVGWAVARDRGPTWNDVDVGFLEDMMEHHSSAIGLSFAEMEREGSDEMTRHFAREIIMAQVREQTVMDEFLAEFDAETTADGTVMAWMGTPFPAVEMPGVPDAADIDELRGAIGVEGIDLFTALMIEHHAAGIVMAEYAEEHGANERVREMARAMATNQTTEIDELNAYRATLDLPAVVPEPLHGHGG